jgi:hypothetical protein
VIAEPPVPLPPPKKEMKPKGDPLPPRMKPKSNERNALDEVNVMRSVSFS